MYLVVGLGNSGEKYKKHRHNVGFLVLDELIDPDDWHKRDEFEGDVALDVVGDDEVIYLKPHTMMNISGRAVKKVADHYGIPSDHIVVVYDDLDIPLGEMKLSFDRGHAGHNGIKSIEEALGTRAFVRMRVGISPVHFGTMRRPKGGDKAGFVLKNFGLFQIGKVKNLAPDIKKLLETLIKEGREKAMNGHN